ncbi:unnamed protein product [Adineta steineri]|uniref:Arrestin C-terminal-like domain-containing protein n=1 Tax=Adineta steineri TaxID=433720 RepID=A0A815XY17_9BILA|nr:unnamed protein product [Adineta steineri]CAF1563180.1 unnamed protein product [Adineta steineri]
MKNQNWFPCLFSNGICLFRINIFQYLLLTLVLLSATSDGSSRTCRFPKNNHNVFWTGGIVSGFIDFVNDDESRLKLERINAELIGEFVQVGKKINDSLPRNISRVKFHTERVLVHPIGTQGNFRVPYGTNSWPFRFQLGTNLPPSLNNNDPYMSSIHYFIHITFVRREWYNLNFESKCPIVVKHLSSSVNAQKVEAKDKNRKGIRMHAVLPENFVTAGNYFSFEVDFYNDKRSTLKIITATLIQNQQLNSEENNLFVLQKQVLQNTQDFKGKRFNGIFRMDVPHTAPAAFTYQLTSNYAKKHLAVNYYVLIEAHLPGFFTNINLILPITITNAMPKKNLRI